MQNAVIGLEPREGEELLRTEDILKVLEDNKDDVSAERMRASLGSRSLSTP